MPGRRDDPEVSIDLRFGTYRATIIHGAVSFGWRRPGDRDWSTDRKSLDEAEAFAGTLVDLIRNERLRQRGAA